MLLALVPAWLLSSPARGAGGVIGEPGSCMIEIGLYTAHFSIYQPDTSGSEVFCEDLPDAAETIFVLDYLHGSMKEVPIDFRIIRDVEDWGIFARWENIQSIEDIEQRTVFYSPPQVRPDNKLQLEHRFSGNGAYIGVVTAPHPTKDILYHAVFPFEVGGASLWIRALAVAVVLGAGILVWRRMSH